MVDAELLSIGSELLLGETVDTNAAFLARELATLGMPVRHARMVPDDRAVIREAFAESRARSAVVLATGGLGPTHDDLTREGLADALGETLAEDPKLVAEIEERFRAFGPMPAANRRQAQLIPSAEAVPNPIGSAPGWWVEREGSVVALMPGVPSEMRLMWTDQLRPRLAPALRPSAAGNAHGEGVRDWRVRTRRAAGDAARRTTGRRRSRDLRPRRRRPRPLLDGRRLWRLDAMVSATREALGENAYGIDEEDLASAALARLGALGAATLASWEADTEGALLAILSATPAREGAARFVGGILDAGGASGPPVGDATIQLSLLPQDSHGRSRVRVAVTGAVSLPQTELRIHGSGPQRLRRAAFAALDAVRRL